MQFNFLSVLLVLFIFKFVVVLLLIERGNIMYLPMPPSWLDISFLFLIRYLQHEFFKKDFIYFLAEGKGGRKRGSETSVCGCLSLAPNWGPSPQPSPVP